jgi:hypothetical protein
LGGIEDLEPLHHPQLAQQAAPANDIAWRLRGSSALPDELFLPLQLW